MRSARDVEATEHPLRIAGENLLPVGVAQMRAVFDVALGVVELMAGFRIDRAHGAKERGWGRLAGLGLG